MSGAGTPRLYAKRESFHSWPLQCASMAQKRRSVAAGKRKPNCGMSRAKKLRAKASRHFNEASSSAASQLSGNPPRSK